VLRKYCEAASRHIARHNKNGSGHRNDILSRSFFTNQILVIRFETVAADLQPAGC